MSTNLILVVEDEEDIRRQFCEALSLEGYTTLEASNGREALQLLETLGDSRQPDCILLDLMMPEMNGDAFLDVIRDQRASRYASVPVIVATAKGSPGPTVRKHRIEAELRKPFDLDDLYRLVAEQISKKAQ